MRSKPTGQKRHLILVPGTKGNHTAPSSYLSPWLACLLSRRIPKPAEAGSSARRRTEMLKESIRRCDPGSSTFYGLEKSKRPEVEGSQRHTAATARPESMGAERGRWPELDPKSHGSQSGIP